MSGAVGVAIAFALTGCGAASTSGASGDGSPAAVPSVKGDGKTVTVWVMNGDYAPATIEAVNAEFTKTTGAEVDVQVQEWEGITTKVSTALATSTPPDVIDLGNTQVAGYAANGGLRDLTAFKADLEQGRTWLSGLEAPATVDGALYAVPGFAGARAVIYNKTMWTAAGVTRVPTTYAELTAALDLVKAANTSPDFSAFYYPGQYWYAGLQWVWDAGGAIATQDGDAWKGGFATPEGEQGLADFKEFQNAYSTTASQGLDTLAPDQFQIFADGKTSAVLSTGGGIAQIQAANPALKEEDLATFPFPGKSGKNQPVMIGGSDWGIAAKSENPDLAIQWAKIAASPAIQDTYVFGAEGWIPNSSEGIEAAQASGLSPQREGFFTAALISNATPAAANWSTIEGDKSINQLFASTSVGSDTPKGAAKKFDSHVASVLSSDN